MSEWVSYQGKPLGKITLNDNGTNKFVYIAEGIDSLITLFSLNPDDEVEIEGRGKIRFEEYKRELDKLVSAFYPTRDAWLLKITKQKLLMNFRNKKAESPSNISANRTI